MSKEDKDTNKLKEGGVRLLTSGEINLAKSVFGSSIDYSTVWIHMKSYLPFNLQNEHTAMTPNGEIYFRDEYRDDFSTTVPNLQHMFIHEMSHIWQREKGMNVIVRGLMSWIVSYKYKLDGRMLSEYPMEQQAQIIADNYILHAHGYRSWKLLIGQNTVTLEGDTSEVLIHKLYNNTLRGFPW